MCGVQNIKVFTLVEDACSPFLVAIDKFDQYIDWHWLIVFGDPGWESTA